MERNFEKMNEWASLLDRLSLLFPTGLLYSTKALQEHPDRPELKAAIRQQFDDITTHYENFMKIAQSTIKRNTRAELQNEFVAAMAGESKAAISGAVELIRKRLKLVEYHISREQVQALPFFADCVTYGVASQDEVLRLSFRIEAAARYRNVLCNQIKEAYLAFLDDEQQPEGGDVELCDKLNTQKARKTFGLAIAKGWIEQQPEGGFEWIGFGKAGNKAKLAYLCAQVYGYQYTANRGNMGNNVPYDALGRLFNVTRLDRAMQQVFEAKKPQLWRRQIDKIIKE
mgnify:CR=1 FL=1